MDKKRMILACDFDGVLHSYSSGWKGIDIIPDPPVEGAIAFLLWAIARYEVNIFSSRSKSYIGRNAMKEWLRKEFTKYLTEHVSAERGFKLAVKAIGYLEFPRDKPPADIILDDKAITFNGDFKDIIKKIENFSPWYENSKNRKYKEVDPEEFKMIFNE